MDGVKNYVQVLGNIKRGCSLESKAASRYVGHVARKECGMENDVMLGEISGKRRRGRPRTRWLDILKHKTTFHYYHEIGHQRISTLETS